MALQTRTSSNFRIILLALACYISCAIRLKKADSARKAEKLAPSRAVHKYLDLLSDGKSDEKQQGELREILSTTPLRGRMLSHSNVELFENLGRKDVPFVWVFGNDALSKFLGKNLYEICRDLGISKEWMRTKLGRAEPWLFRLVVFEEQQDLDCLVNTWQGAVNWISRHYPPQVVKKIASQLDQLAQKDFKTIEKETLGDNRTMWDVFVNKDADLKRSYNLEDESCEGNMYQVRQWLYDRGFREEYQGDGLTTGGSIEYICLNKPIASIQTAAHMDFGSLEPFSSQILAEEEHIEGAESLESS